MFESLQRYLLSVLKLSPQIKYSWGMNTQEFLEFFKRKYFCCFLFLLEKINILFRLSGCFKFWYFIHVNVIVYIFSKVFVKFEINPFIPSTLNYERSWMLTFFPWNRIREIIVILLSNKEWWDLLWHCQCAILCVKLGGIYYC